MRVKRRPARARRYCPVMVQVHRRWIWLNLLTRYSRRAALSPREGYSPGEAAVTAEKEAAQHRDQDDGDPGGDERVEPHVPDDLRQRRDPEVVTGELRLSGRDEA